MYISIYFYISPSLHLYIPTSLHLYISTSLHLYISTSLHPYISISLHLYISTSLHLYISTSLHPYISTSLYLYISISLYLFISLSLYLYISISLHLQISISLYLQYIIISISLTPRWLDSTLNVHSKSLNSHSRLVSIVWLFKTTPYGLLDEVRVRSRLLVTLAASLLSHHGRGHGVCSRWLSSFSPSICNGHKGRWVSKELARQDSNNSFPKLLADHLL